MYTRQAVNFYTVNDLNGHNGFEYIDDVITGINDKGLFRNVSAYALKEKRDGANNHKS